MRDDCRNGLADHLAHKRNKRPDVQAYKSLNTADSKQPWAAEHPTTEAGARAHSAVDSVWVNTRSTTKRFV
jgi:hypothetical protein